MSFFIITKNRIRNLKNELKDSNNLSSVKSELKKMLKIKETLFWHSDTVGGCAAVHSLTGELLRQVEAVERIIANLERGDIDDAISELEWYEAYGLVPEDEKEIKDLTKKVTAKFGETKDEIKKVLEIEKLLFQQSEKLVS